MLHALPRLVASLFFLAVAATADEWPQFRGPGGQGVSPAKNLPATWSDSENLRWKTELPGAGASSPILVGNQVILTCHSGYGLDRQNPGNMADLKLHVVSIDRASGNLLWDTVVEPTLPESPQVRDHGYAAPTPASDGEHLYVFFGKSGVLKLDLEGKILWRSSVGTRLHGWGCGTSPVLAGDLVIVNASVESGSLVALAKADGKEVWRADGMRESWNTPHLVDLPDGKQELVVAVKDRVLAFEPATGQSLWQCDAIRDYVCPSIVSRDGILYAIGGRRSQAVAIRAGGRGDVTATHRLWVAEVGANVSSPVLHGDHLYWASDRNGMAYCLAIQDGSVVYAEQAGRPYASMVAADGKLFVTQRNGETIVLPAKPEFAILAKNRFSDQSTFNGSLAVADGQLFLRSDRYLYAIGQNQ